MASSERAPRAPYQAAGVLALGLVLSAIVLGLFFHAARTPGITVQVVGSATERFTSDVAKWRLTIARPAGEGALQAGYEAIAADLEHFAERLRAVGIPDSSMDVQPVNAQPMWGPSGRREGYNLVQSAYVISSDPAQLEALARNPAALLREGAALESSSLEYYYSGTDELKRSLLAAAMRDARRRAAEIAGADDAEVGAMRTARAGVFQITEPYSTEVSSMGMYSTSTRDKEISVTVHATFETR